MSVTLVWSRPSDMSQCLQLSICMIFVKEQGWTYKLFLFSGWSLEWAWVDKFAKCHNISRRNGVYPVIA